MKGPMRLATFVVLATASAAGAALAGSGDGACETAASPGSCPTGTNSLLQMGAKTQKTAPQAGVHAALQMGYQQGAGSKEKQGDDNITVSPHCGESMFDGIQSVAADSMRASWGRTVAEECVDGIAAGYPCDGINLVSFVSSSDLNNGGSTSALNDIWGWTDASTGKEYAIVGMKHGTAFVDISQPAQPVVVGKMSFQTSSSSWRDIKVYSNHAFVVSEARNHGMQVFDLTRLRQGGQHRDFAPDAFYDQIGNAHNIVINEDSGTAFIVGANGANGGVGCSGGLHMVDVSNPLAPAFLGCFSQDGYTHDAQCVIYDGPDTEHRGKEVCFCFNEDTVTVVDVTDKASPRMLSRVGYPGDQYTHQGWLDGQQAYLFVNDELDEMRSTNKRTKTLIFNVADLDSPAYATHYLSPVQAIDHNLYVKDGYVYQANYCAGLRVLKINPGDPPELEEFTSFDVEPSCSSASFSGSWSVYPFFASGNIVVSSIPRGLFVLRHADAPATTPPGTPETPTTESSTTTASSTTTVTSTTTLTTNTESSTTTASSTTTTVTTTTTATATTTTETSTLTATQTTTTQTTNTETITTTVTSTTTLTTTTESSTTTATSTTTLTTTTESSTTTVTITTTTVTITTTATSTTLTTATESSTTTKLSTTTYMIFATWYLSYMFAL